MGVVLKRIEEPLVFEISNDSGAAAIMDASEDVGGKNKGMRPMEFLAGAIAGCMSIDLLIVLQKKRLNPKHFSISIDSERTGGTPSPFTKVVLNIHIDKDIDREMVSKNAYLILEKYCSVSSSLDPDIQITVEVHPAN